MTNRLRCAIMAYHHRMEEAVKALFFACTLAVGSFSVAPAIAQPAVRIVMPFPAGAAADSVARIVAPPLSRALGQPVVIDNRIGADGAIAAEHAARSPADGQTLLFAGNTQMLGVPTLRKNPPYDPLVDFVPIAPVVRFAFFLVVHPDTPAQNLAQLLEHARAHPGKLNYASGNVNGVLAAAQMMSAAKVQMVHVPYKGEPLAVPDLVEGRVHLMFASGAVVAPLVKQGKLRALVTLLPTRSTLLPDVPTAAEAGLPQLSVLIWGGLFGPAKMPMERVESISREVNTILKQPEVREQLQMQGVEPFAATPAEFAKFLREQLSDWAQAAREAGLKPE
jgi:tripartite-type tricarboxylate transporter receptor subunit TctC